MRRQHTTENAYPPQLLDEYLRLLRRRSPDAPGAAALHTRSPDARILLARAAGDASVDELLAAAQGRPGAHPPLATADPYALGELARVIALQDLHPDDVGDGLALFELVLATFGAARVAPAHQGLHCQLAYASGRRQRAVELLAAYRRVPEPVRDSLRVDLANPYVGGTSTPDGWLAAFRTLLPGPAVRLRPAAGTGEPVFDRLESPRAPLSGAAHRITTIVTTYRPGAALLTTVRSLVAQTWTNHEILVMDDGSGHEFEPVLRAAAALDARVRVIRMPVNGGTYVARNEGLGVATGTFVTFQDSDDWSHPCRLERQVRPLLADASLVATTSVGMRVTEDLVVTRPGWEQSRSYNLSSLMLRRRPALVHLGYLDVVRKGADAEYVERARAVFGRPAVRHVTGAPLALIRLSSTSLSSADMRPGWMHPARHAYLSAFQAWHRGIVADGRPARRPARPARRVFAAPRRLSGARDARTRYDVVLAGDWTAAGTWATVGGPEAAAGRARALAKHGLRVAVLHLDDVATLRDGSRNLDDAVQTLVNTGVVDQVVLADDVRAGLLIVGSPAVLHFAPGTAAENPGSGNRLRADRVVIETAGAADAPGVCAASAHRLFGVEPRFAPPGPRVREVLGRYPDPPALTDLDLPGTVDLRQWRLDRRGPRSDRPVVGRVCAGGRAEWLHLLRVLPDSPDVDVRLLRRGGSRPGFGKAGPPRHWLVYEPAETAVRSFLFQLDFYVAAPEQAAPKQGAPAWGALDDVDPMLLQAFAAGCVVVLPQDWAPVFGDAAVYSDAAGLERTLWDLHARPDAFALQSGRGRDLVRQRHDHEHHAERVAALLH